MANIFFSADFCIKRRTGIKMSSHHKNRLEKNLCGGPQSNELQRLSCDTNVKKIGSSKAIVDGQVLVKVGAKDIDI